MLNHLLAGIVALGSLVLFLSGFLFPEVQRKPDLAWSGVALLYALLLFGEGDRTSGGVLLGHIASVALILWFGWQTLQQRRQFTTPDNQTAIPGSLEALMPFLKEGWGRILVTYGEASVWVQDQLNKGNENQPEIKTPPAPLQEIDDNDWEDSGAAASLTTEPPSMETLESPGIEALESSGSEALAEEKETEAISVPQESSLSNPEVLAQMPSVLENMAEPASTSDEEAATTPTAADLPLSHPEEQVEPSIHSESSVEAEVPITTVADPSVEPEALPIKETEPSVAPEAHTQAEAALEQEQPPASMVMEHSTATMDVSHDNPEPEIAPDKPIENLEQNSISKDNNETIRVDDDKSWPPEDPIT